MFTRLTLAIVPLLLALGCASHSAVAPLDVKSLKSFRSELRCDLNIEALPADAKTVRVWIPLPAPSEFQEISNLRIKPQAGALRRERLYGNQLLYLEWNAPFAEAPAASIAYDLLRREAVAHPEPTNAALVARCLAADRLGIIDQQVREMAAKATAGREDVSAKARGIYDAVLAHMQYDKVAPGWGKGDTARACAVGKGNCSDYHTLFISMARAVGIPARFHYGYSLKSDGQVGAHCWAEFLDPAQGWIPVDISEADKDPAKIDYHFGRLSENRVLASTGRDLILDPPQAGEPLNFLIDAYVEVDGKPHRALRFSARHQPPPSPAAGAASGG